MTDKASSSNGELGKDVKPKLEAKLEDKASDSSTCDNDNPQLAIAQTNAIVTSAGSEIGTSSKNSQANTDQGNNQVTSDPNEADANRKVTKHDHEACADKKQESQQSSDATALQYVGFDAVVREERKARKLTFGPNSKKVIKPSNVLIDIYGVICSWKFVKTLRQFALDNIANYVRDHWNDKGMKVIVARLREQVAIDRKVNDQLPDIAPESAALEDQIVSVGISVHWQLENKHKTTKKQIDRMCADLWSKSYDNGKLKTHAYEDVPVAFNYWRFEEFIKIYLYASGTVEGQRQFLRASELGDLNRFIANGLNATGGYKFDSDKFKSVASALREPNLQNLLYITDSPKKAKSAIKAGLRAVVVNRTGADTGNYRPQETEGLLVVHSLSDIEFVDDPNHTVPMNCC